MKKIFLTILTASLAFSSFAQEAVVEKTFWDDPINHPMLPVYAITSLVFIVIVLVMMVAIYLTRVINMLTTQFEKDRAAKLGIAYVAPQSWWQRFVQRVNGSVPLEKEKDIILDHNYDGIKELDNHLPPWWKWLFYGTIGWSAIYIIAYHITDALPLSEQEYNHEVTLAEEQINKYKASQPKAAIDENALTFNKDAILIEKGKKVFTNNSCGSCHRSDGGGNTIGPNLTDEYWIHGGDIKNIFHTIKEGVVEKGMPAWGKSMSPEDVRNVAFYVMSLQGTNPPQAKAPQGQLFKQTTVNQSDSTKTQASL
jgi:cytochrome c oxidase cbb3-type subunit 3